MPHCAGYVTSPPRPIPRHGLNASWHSKAIQLSFLDPPRIRFTDSGDDHRSSDSESKLPL